MRNPYVAAIANAAAAARDQAPAHPTSDAPPIPERVQAFFDAMDIGHPGNRAKVCTAIAHTMSTTELNEAISRLAAERNDRIDRLVALKAPDVIIANERRSHPSNRILERVRATRG